MKDKAAMATNLQEMRIADVVDDERRRWEAEKLIWLREDADKAEKERMTYQLEVKGLTKTAIADTKEMAHLQVENASLKADLRVKDHARLAEVGIVWSSLDWDIEADDCEVGPRSIVADSQGSSV